MRLDAGAPALSEAEGLAMRLSLGAMAIAFVAVTGRPLGLRRSRAGSIRSWRCGTSGADPEAW